MRRGPQDLELEARQVWRLRVVHENATKNRVAVIVAIVPRPEGDVVQFAYAQSRDGGDSRAIKLTPESQTGKSLRIDRPCCFRPGNVQILYAKDLELLEPLGRCPPSLFVELRLFAEDHDEWYADQLEGHHYAKTYRAEAVPDDPPLATVDAEE